MCGICGLIDLKHSSGMELRAGVQRMTRLLAHRGPDAEGVWHEPGIALGHRRLSILDLTGSTQPMVDASERFVLVFNGEIYNYIEIRSELQQKGIRFSSHGDTEVLLASYIHYGPSCLDHLNGMFAFAIWDRKERSLFAARDRMGVKPLFWGTNSSGLFAFASELQALRELPLDFSINKASLYAYLHHGFIRSPNTIFRGIQELRASHQLRLDSGGPSTKRYWQLPVPEAGSLRSSEAEQVEELRSLIRSAIQIRLRSDVPLGAFLSGGLDSSIVVAGMRELSNTELHSFSIGFDGEGFDEAPHARKFANHFGTYHHENRVKPDAHELLLDLVRHYGQPFGDSSAIPMWLLCRETRRGVTVALSGDGADEIFCGYRRYVARRMLEWYQLLPERFRRELLGGFAKRLPEGTAYYDHSIVKKLKLFSALDNRVTQDPNDMYPAYFTKEELAKLLDLSPAELEVTQDTCNPASSQKAGDRIEQMMRSDLLHYLPDDILTKVDRTSMAHGLEVRSPFMDYRIVEYAARLPLPMKLRGLTTKFILRKAFERELPRQTLRRPKHGFAVPLGDYFHGPMKETYREIVLTSKSPQWIKRSEAERLLQEHLSGRIDHGHRLWLLLFLHAWARWWNGQ